MINHALDNTRDDIADTGNYDEPDDFDHINACDDGSFPNIIEVDSVEFTGKPCLKEL